MNYYPWHIGDYLAHTAHLSVIEDCAYRRLLDSYYLTEKALPLDIASCARLIRMREHAAEVEVVLREFFTETPGGWVQERCDAEILKYQDKTVKAKASARASVQSRQAFAERQLNERLTDVDTNAELTKNQEPITNTSPKGDGARKRAAASAARPDEVSEPVWQDFQRLRREKRAPLTDTALAGVRREAEKAGVPLEAAIAYCCEAGWQGFNAGWYADRTKGKSTINGGSGREAPHKFAGASAAIYEGVFE